MSKHAHCPLSPPARADSLKTFSRASSAHLRFKPSSKAPRRRTLSVALLIVCTGLGWILLSALWPGLLKVADTFQRRRMYASCTLPTRTLHFPTAITMAGRKRWPPPQSAATPRTASSTAGDTMQSSPPCAAMPTCLWLRYWSRCTTRCLCTCAGTVVFAQAQQPRAAPRHLHGVWRPQQRSGTPCRRTGGASVLGRPLLSQQLARWTVGTLSQHAPAVCTSVPVQ